MATITTLTAADSLVDVPAELVSVLETAGFDVGLLVRRRDGRRLDTADEKRLATVLRTHEAGRDLDLTEAEAMAAVARHEQKAAGTDDELAEAIELASLQPLTSTESTPLATLVAAPSALASSLASVGLAAHLVVQRRDGRLLTANDQAAAQALVACHEIEAERVVTDDEAAGAAVRALGPGTPPPDRRRS